MPDPSNRNESEPGSGTADKVIWPEKVLAAKPFVASEARTDWNGTLLNCDAKIPVQTDVPSRDTPPILNVTVDDVAVRFCRLNGDPGGEQICPAAGGVALQPAAPLIPSGKLVSSKTVLIPPLIKLRSGTGGNIVGGISGGLNWVNMLAASLPEIPVGMSPFGSPNGAMSTLPFWAGVPVSAN